MTVSRSGALRDKVASRLFRVVGLAQPPRAVQRRLQSDPILRGVLLIEEFLKLVLLRVRQLHALRLGPQRSRARVCHSLRRVPPGALAESEGDGVRAKDQ